MTPYLPGTSRVQWLMDNDPAYRALKERAGGKRARDPNKPRLSIADLAGKKRH